MQTNFQDVQRHLLWSFMLSGAAGHTYGAAGIHGERKLSLVQSKDLR